MLHQEYQRAVIFRLGRVKKGGAVGPGVIFRITVDDQNIFMFFKDIHYWWQSSHSLIGHYCLLDVLSTKNLRRSFLHHSLYGYHPGGRPQVHNDDDDDTDGDDCDLTPIMINIMTTLTLAMMFCCSTRCLTKVSGTV